MYRTHINFNIVMNKVILLLAALFVCSLGYGQRISKKLEKKYQEVELWKEEDGKWYRVKNDDKYGLTDENGKEILPCRFDRVYISTICRMKDDTYPIIVEMDGKEGIYDMTGKEIFPFLYESAYLACESETETYYAKVKNNGKQGICMLNGKEVVPCKYELVDLRYERDSKTFYVMLEDNGKWGICMMDGKEIIPCKYELAGLQYEKGSKIFYINIENNGRSGICTMDGKEIIPCIYDQAYITSTLKGIPYAVVIKDDKWGLSNLEGKVMVPCKYDQARLGYIEESNFYYASVYNNGKYGICTLDGKEVLPCIYEYANVEREETNGLLYVVKNLNGKVGISTVSGEEIIPCEYSYASMAYDEEAKSNYYLAINNNDEIYCSKKFNLLGDLISERTIKRSQQSKTASEQDNGLSKLKKTVLILQMLTQGMQAMSGYMNTYSSGNIYVPQNNPSYSHQTKTCSLCRGTGYNPGKERPPFYSYSEDPMTGHCDICGDMSNHYHNPCPSCNGKGYR